MVNKKDIQGVYECIKTEMVNASEHEKIKEFLLRLNKINGGC